VPSIGSALAGTAPNRVAVHSLHQHDGVRCDFTAAQLMEDQGLGGTRFNVSFSRAVIERVCDAIRTSIAKPVHVTHIGTGMAKVEKVASNRRILGPDGKVALMRFSASRDPEAIAAPEGVIDPFLRLISFWNEDQPLASLTYYATHPQSYYGKGDVTSEFVGIARDRRARDIPDAVHIHFNGAGGNIAAGKYNDGSPERRPILAARMEKAMRAAWEATRKTPVRGSDVRWNVEAVRLPAAEHLDATQLRATLDKENAPAKVRFAAALKLAWLNRVVAGREIDVTCLSLADVSILHLPGELFVEYQLAAQQMRPDRFVCLAAYGDYGPGYIGTTRAYAQGGYETSARASYVAPEVEAVLTKALRRLLQPKEK
jgi:hypothetical protein